MDLREFVSITLTQIVQGVSDSAAAISELGGAVSPAFSGGGKTEHIGFSKDGTSALVFAVDFDVAIVAANTSGGEGGAKLQVAGVLNIGGKAKAEEKNESTSRVRFSVPLQLPTDPKSRQAADEQATIQQEAMRARSRRFSAPRI